MRSSTRPRAPESAHTQSAEAVALALDVSPDVGLSSHEAHRRARQFGPNRLRHTERRGAWAILVDQFRSLIAALLAVGAILSFAFDHPAEGAAIVAVILLNGAIGFFTELRAVRSMEGLRKLGDVLATVRRDGRLIRVPAQELVPGDVVALQGGDVVTADLRLVELSRLQVDEAPLTGESVPVDKEVAPVAEDAPLGDRKNMVWKGCAITRGAGEGLVVATGMETELGRISALVDEAPDQDTPLERRLDRLARVLAGASLAFVAAVVVIGMLTGSDLYLIVETGIALAVATVPEGLPIVATLALARGMWRMARRNALIEELPAVETLGSTDVILTDKTGTLTENRMRVRRVVADRIDVHVAPGAEGELLFESDGVAASPAGTLVDVLESAALCTDAELDPSGSEKLAVGDPMEVALLEAAEGAGLFARELRERLPELRAEAFDPELKLMATFHRDRDAIRVAVKGAPESVLSVCTHVATSEGPRACTPLELEAHRAHSEDLGREGLRVIAVARKDVRDVGEDPYSDLTFLGLVGLLDPPRLEAVTALRACEEAGVRVVMVTGDHAETARAVGRSVGLASPETADADELVIGGVELDASSMSVTEAERILDARVVARCSPEQKLRLLTLYQARGWTVAMVGDGVNDAPALKQADIGVAMGQRGTQVAREAAAMVLMDDDFRTIIVAIEQGRVIYANIRKFVIYLVSCNLSEILIIGLAALASAPQPILPLQLLFLNLVTDVFPALALGVGEGDPGVMRRPPRPRGEPFLTRGHWRLVVGYATLLALAVLAAFAYALHVLHLPSGDAVTIAFLALALGQMWHTLNLAERGAPVIVNEVSRNPWVWAALLVCALLIAASIFIPPLADVLGLVAPSAVGWATATLFSLVPLGVGMLYRKLR